MFKQMKNIDTAFRSIRSFTIIVIIGCVLLCCFTLYKSFRLVAEMQSKVYILANGKALEVYASDRKENIPVASPDLHRPFGSSFASSAPACQYHHY